VLFDGQCNLCNGTVRFLVPRDPKAKLRFAALQSETGQRLLQKFDLSTVVLDTFILIEEKHCYQKSTGALRVTRYLRFPWLAFQALLIVPAFLRDVVYDFVARNRYDWFGRLDHCPLLTPELSDRFLD
jgi:predicted DCC family thiol-disulfide oxidoreductase YuxK